MVFVTGCMIQYRVSWPDLEVFYSHQCEHDRVRAGYLANVFCTVRVLDENVPEERLSQVTSSVPTHPVTYKYFPVS
jgi:hypothetical protein